MVQSIRRHKKGAQHVIIVLVFVICIVNTAVFDFFLAQNQSLIQTSLSPAHEKSSVRNNDDKKPGFIVLGMHRSGTSMLSGVLVEGFGYETGGPLLPAQSDNVKVRFIELYTLFIGILVLFLICT